MQELAVLAARTMATQRQFTAIADNVANANSHGYKRLDLQFEELVSRPKAHATASYVADRGIVVDYSQGGFETTGNPLDVAIGGEGFFAIQVNGQTQYTRKGQFLTDAEGTLMTPSGNPVLDNAGAQIQLPPGTREIIIGRDGSLATEQGMIAQIGVYTFAEDDLGKLQRAGDGNFTAQLGAAALVVENPSLKQGMLEGSNVNAVQEMVTMQGVSRAYQSAVTLMKGLEDVESSAIQRLGRMQ